MKYTEQTLQAVLKAIPEGRESAIHQAKLAQQLDMHPQTLKACIRQLRRDYGGIICSSAIGYWRSTSRKEIAAFLNMQEGQAKTRLATIKRMREFLKIPEGQLDLFSESEGR